MTRGIWKHSTEIRSGFDFQHYIIGISLRMTYSEALGRVICTRNTSLTAVVKKVVGTHYFLAIFGPLGAHFNPQPLRQPHGMTVSHIVKVNHTVVEKELEYD